MRIDFMIALAGLSAGFIGLCPARAEGPAGNWPQWRGPSRDSQVVATQWPASLGTLQPRWRVDLGPSYSGPIVWGNRIFVTETVDREHEVVQALDRSTGQPLWRASWKGALSVPFFAKSNGDWIRSTPACDGDALYVGGMRDTLVCLDAATGSERWRLDFPAQVGSRVPAFGMVCSPLVSGDFVFVQAGGGFAKIDKRTGALIWKVLDDGGAMNSAFSSPIVTAIGGVDQLLVQTRHELAGVRPGDGQVLWRQAVPAYRGMNILTPTVFGDGVLTSTYKNRTFFYGVSAATEGFSVSEAWSVPSQGYMSSPVVIGTHAYLHLGNGRLSCIDLSDGKERWRSTPFGKYWSMIANADRILALDERGELLLIEANPAAFRLLDRKTVSARECWAHLAVAAEDVVVRDLSGVALFQWQASEDRPAESGAATPFQIP